MKSRPLTSIDPAILSSTPATPPIDRRRAITTLAMAGLALPTAVFPSVASPTEPGTAQSAALLGDRMMRRTTGASRYKQLAATDYAANTAQFGGRLACSIDGLRREQPRGVPWQFDVVIVGSGYGAAVTAARLAQRMRPGTRLAIIERGREWVPGSFPDTVQDMVTASRNRLIAQNDQVRDPLGLFNVRQFREIHVLSGTGLGGSSLINAGVALRPDWDVFQQAAWPSVLRDRMFLDPYYDLAEWELGVAREASDASDKMRAQRLAAEKLRDCGAHFEAAALTLTRGRQDCELPILNRQGWRQRACIDCGDCLTGCNVGAKNTLAMNYLPLARRAGAEIYTQTEIHHLEKCGDYYRLHAMVHPEDALSSKEACPIQITSRVVVLAAGSIGSTEILLRSASDSLSLSCQLGSRWTGNGDALGFIRRSQHRTGISGWGAYEKDLSPVGPTIQSNITYPRRPLLQHRVLVQEGAAVRAYVNAISVLMHDLDLDHTQILLGMGHDGAQGRITLDGDTARLDWPGITDSAYRQFIRLEFRRIAEAHGGEYSFLRVFGDKMISVHPLGGCGMGDGPDQGVVNHKGEVFDASRGGDVDATTGQVRVHSGLYVCDGSVIPTSIACNPLLTISAVAERTAEMLAMEPRYSDLFRAAAA